MKVPFFRLKLSSVEEREVMKVLRSGWVTTGPAVREFEDRVKKISGARYAVAVSSCTAGLHLALEALDIGPDDEVITTPFTMAATIEAILYCGATPIFADIDPITLNIDPNQIENKISSKTRAIIPVDIAGLPCDYDRLKKLARKDNLFIIEDAAHSLGAEFRGNPVGSLVDMTAFSFYSTKNITTGEGGMVVTNQKRIADKIRRLSLHGMTSSGWKRYSGGGWKYDIIDLGYKYNLSDLAAGLGLGQLERFNAFREKREKLAERYFLGLQDLKEYVELPRVDGKLRHAWHLFIIKIIPEKWKIGRDRIIDELESRGIGCGVHFIPIYHFSYFKKDLKLRRSNFPNTERSFRRVISLPFYFDLSFRQVDHVCAVMRDLVKKYGNI